MLTQAFWKFESAGHTGKPRPKLFAGSGEKLAVICTLAGALVLTLSGYDGGPGAVSVFTPTNEVGSAACDGVRGDLISNRVAEVLKSRVIASIEKQIQETNSEKKELRPVMVRIFLVSFDELTKELKDDARNDLNATNIFNAFDAYTYAPNPDNTNTVKIKIFCKPSIQADITENDDKHGFDRKPVQELVHAKVISMQDIGEKPPFTDGKDKDDPPPDDHKEDHNGKFSKEVDKLTKELLK